MIYIYIYIYIYKLFREHDLRYTTQCFNAIENSLIS